MRRYFDVVIFDEASQIPLEEAVPSLFRAVQAIVVGDEMQLPPTSFFASKQPEDEEGLVIEEGGEVVSYELESNSFLNHAARNLPATMLGWHYRSRSESLISFSNWAFYEGRLLTVPEEAIGVDRAHAACCEPRRGGRTGRRTNLSLGQSASTILQHGVYEQRRNPAEAEYIARLVRRLLIAAVPTRVSASLRFRKRSRRRSTTHWPVSAREDDDFRELL